MGKKEEKEKKKREDENMLWNGGLLLEKRIFYFNGKYSNPIRTFSAEELQKATDNYSHENRIFQKLVNIQWYKGCLEGRMIFVKKYESYYPRFDVNRESFSNEIAVAAQVSGHKNALKLLGCCLETPKLTPVFEFPKNGKLDNQLTSNPTCLPWRIRLKIANEIALVITYLHTKFPRPIIHRDIHLRHFHLDQDFSAKLSDFTHCMSLPEGKTQVEDHIFRSPGYLEPKVFLSRVYSEKSDVFCFGLLLLYLLMGKRYQVMEFFEQDTPHYIRNITINDIRNHTMNEILDPRILSYIRNHTMNEIVDPTILAKAGAAGGGEGVHHHHHQFQAVLELILRCIRHNAEERPIMLDVAKQLKRIQRGDFTFNEAYHNGASSSSNIGYPNKQ